MKKMTSDNRGLSLIELLVAIVVLGIICIPLITTFINSARINRNAKRVHSASTLAQSLMEEYKATNISVLLQDVSEGSVSASYYASLDSEQQKIVSGNQEAFIPYVFYQTGIAATNGHVYDARITLNPMPYSSFDLSVSNSSNANTVQIPTLPQVDNAKSAVISSQITAQDNKISGGVSNYAAEKKILALFGGYSSADLISEGILKNTPGKTAEENMKDTLVGISNKLEKKIILTVENDPAHVPAGFAAVTCDVEYKYDYAGSLISDSSVTVNAYQSYYSIDAPTPPDADDASEELPGRMTVYLFWTPSPYNTGNDEIVIRNNTNCRIDVYLIKQDSAFGVNRKIYLADASSQTEFKPDSETSHKDGRMCAHNINLISNLGVDYSKLYEQDAKLRCYEVKVEIFEGNGTDVYDLSSTAQVTTMTSTKEVYQ